jgi:hypothetical protein
MAKPLPVCDGFIRVRCVYGGAAMERVAKTGNRFGLFVFLTASVTVLDFAGCGASGPDIVQVSGVLTRHGQPVPNVTVFFQPASGRPSIGECDGQGHFKLRYTRDRDGAKVGSHTVYVIYTPEPTRGPAPPDLKLIAAKYSSPETSPMKIDIKKPHHNLEIKLD